VSNGDIVVFILLAENVDGSSNYKTVNSIKLVHLYGQSGLYRKMIERLGKTKPQDLSEFYAG
jgi:hypothetical protein